MQLLQTFLQFCADMLLDNFFFEIIKRANPYHKVVPFFAKDETNFTFFLPFRGVAALVKLAAEILKGIIGSLQRR